MNADTAIAAEQFVAVTAIAAGDLLAQGSNRRLPAPKRIVATFGFYGILGLFASLGPAQARLAAAVGGVAMLTALVLGAGGKAITDLIGNLSGLLGGSNANLSGASAGNLTGDGTGTGTTGQGVAGRTKGGSQPLHPYPGAPNDRNPAYTAPPPGSKLV